MFLAHDFWYLGCPDRARVAAEEAVRWSRELNHPYSLAASSAHCAWVHILLREPAQVAAYADECCKISTEYGFPFHIAHARAFRGWARSQLSEPEQGGKEIQEGIELYEKIGDVVERPGMALLLANALADLGRHDGALKTIEAARTGIESESPLFCGAELARARGELLVATGGDLEEVEQCFSLVLQTARQQNAKSLELRATISFVRLRDSQNRKAEARQLLDGIYRWFTEGFQTADLRNARGLLESLE